MTPKKKEFQFYLIWMSIVLYIALFLNIKKAIYVNK